MIRAAQALRARWDVLAVAVTTLLVWLLSTPASAIFLQRDTANQDFVALAWVQGCWEFFTEKMLGVFLLGPFFRLLGPSTRWETLLLALAVVASTALVYELARLISKSRLAGLIAVGLLLSLPAFQFFNRTYFGYLFPFLLLGWLFAYYRRWFWAGISFGLAILGHFNSLVPAGLSSLFLYALMLRNESWRRGLAYGVGVFLPLVMTEAVFFVYMGHVYPLIWTRGTLAVITSPLVDYILEPGWLWVGQATALTNGWLLGLALLGLTLAAPVVLRRNRFGLALSLSFVGIIAFYTSQAGITNRIVVPRLLVSALPFWCVCAAVVAVKFSAVLQHTYIKGAVAAVAIAGLLVGIVSTAIFIRRFTQTLNPQVEQSFTRAATEARPVRMIGHPQVALYYAQLYGVEMLVNDDRWIAAGAPEQAVLIFAGSAPASLSRDGYAVTKYAVPADFDRRYPLLTAEAGMDRNMEVWWPSGASSAVEPASPTNLAVASYYYSGTGCFTPPVYSDGDQPRALHYYQLAWKKLLDLAGRA